MSEYLIRVGDQDDYHEEDMDGLVDRLRMCRVEGPLTPYICGSRWAGPEMHGKVMGVESACCHGRNYISLFVQGHCIDAAGRLTGSREYGRSITDEELAELNRRL